MQLLRARDYRRMRWKNGLGETTEIAVSPADAALDRFDWRVSMARVEADGPFSAFEGVDRTLTVLEGTGIALSVADDAPVELTPRSAPFAFPGDRPSAAVLRGGPIKDLNVMTRRARCWHRVTRCRAAPSLRIATEASTVLVLAAGAPLEVACGRSRVSLGVLDAALGTAGVLELTGIAAGTDAFLIEIGTR